MMDQDSRSVGETAAKIRTPQRAYQALLARGVRVVAGADGITQLHIPQGGRVVTAAAGGKQAGLLVAQVWREAAGGKYLPTDKQVKEVVRLFEIDGAGTPPVAMYVRTAPRAGGGGYLDLADGTGQAAEWGADGWRVVADPPVRFRRPIGSGPLPVPVPGGSLDVLRGLMNVTDDAAWALAKGFLAAAARPHGPHMVLSLVGPPGSAKSTFMKMAKGLIDPPDGLIPEWGTDELPATAEGLALAGNNQKLVLADNLAPIARGGMSNTLCQMATGGRARRRKLYSDDEEVVLKFNCPVILAGVEQPIKAPDLRDRAVTVRLGIPAARRTAADLWAAYEGARPAALGGLLDALVQAARAFPTAAPVAARMADAVKWADCSLSPRGAFLAAYERSRAAATDDDLLAWPLFGPLFAVAQAGFEGPATALLDRLREATPAEARAALPPAPNALVRQLAEREADLLNLGVVCRRASRRNGSSKDWVVMMEGAKEPTGSAA